MVQAQRTSSNLLEPQHHRASKVGTRSGLLKHIEPHRTYRKHTTTEIARCVGCFCTKSGWFKHIEPTRTTPSQRCVGCLCTSSGWFKHIEPPRTYTLLTITELTALLHKLHKCRPLDGAMAKVLCSHVVALPVSRPSLPHLLPRSLSLSLFLSPALPPRTSWRRRSRVVQSILYLPQSRTRPQTSDLHTLLTVLVWFV